MKKLFYALFPLLFSFLYVSAQSYRIAALPIKSYSNQCKNQNYYFQAGNQLLRELYSYEIRELDASNSVDQFIQEPVAYLVGKLNTDEILNLSKLLYPGNTDAIKVNLNTEEKYQIIFSGNLRFQAVEFNDHFADGLGTNLNTGKPINYDIEFYGTDTITLRPNDTNVIIVDFAQPPRLISHNRSVKKMRWQLQVTNK